jgi:hypothetical protein
MMIYTSLVVELPPSHRDANASMRDKSTTQHGHQARWTRVHDLKDFTHQRTNRANDMVHSNRLTHNSWYCYIVNGRWGAIHTRHDSLALAEIIARSLRSRAKRSLFARLVPWSTLRCALLSSPFARTQHTMQFTSHRPGFVPVTPCHWRLYSLLQITFTGRVTPSRMHSPRIERLHSCPSPLSLSLPLAR